MSKFAWLAVAALIAAPAIASSSGQAADATKEKPVCKKAVETGSLVKAKKVCMTRAQWNEVSRKGQEQGREMQTLISTEQGR